VPIPQIAGLPPNLDLDAGYQLVFTAINATTGAQIGGVAVTDATIRAQNVGGTDAADLAFGPFRLVPGPGA
jgi:hypothetical protein